MKNGYFETMGGTSTVAFAHRELLKPGAFRLTAAVVVFLTAQYIIYGPLDTGETMTWTQRLLFWGLLGLVMFPLGYASGVLTTFLVRKQRLVVIGLALTAMAAILSACCAAMDMMIYDLLTDTPRDLPFAKSFGVCSLNVASGVAFVYYALRVRIKGARGSIDATESGTPSAGQEGSHDREDPAIAGAPAMPPRSPAGTVPAPTGGSPENANVSEPSRVEPAVESRFFARLPAELGHDIIYLSAAAHYVDVITAAGSASILLRFSDAVAELGDMGIRVHRSYWAAYRHIKQAARREGRTVLLLTDDHEVRVGRNYLPEVRAAVPKAWVRARRRRVKPGPSASDPASPGTS